MRVWRVCKAGRASTAFDGEGAKLLGGRWNHKGVSVVYTSEHLSNAILETLVHLESSILPTSFVKIFAEIPNVESETVSVEKLPDDWANYPSPEILKDIGTEWLNSKRTLILAVPSAICPEESNFLINPRHPDARLLKIGTPAPFKFDPRLAPKISRS